MSYYSVVSIVAYFLVMLLIGLYAMRKSTANNDEYLLGGRNISAKVTALSAGASDMSGWMLMGLPGAAFVSGLDSIWIGLGLIIGAFFNYQIVAPRLRVYTEEADNSLTVPEFFSKRFSLQNSFVRIVASIVIICFFTLYTSSGLVAGGKLFQSAFGLDYSMGVYLTISVVIIYTVLGGFLAVSLTDFVQGCIMFLALICVPVFAFIELEPNTNLIGNTLNAFYQSSAAWEGFGWLTILSLMSWGLGYFGQPHIIVRFMAINHVSSVKTARNIGMSWMTVSLIGALLTGLVGFYYTQQQGITVNDPETIFVLLSTTLFHPLVAGWLLAAILAAIMSTISSQLLVSSSSLVEDFYRIFIDKKASEQRLVLVSRLCVLAVALVATYISLDPGQNVLSIVSSAWAGFGAAFGPVILFALLWKRMSNAGAIAGIITGALTVLFWGHVPVLENGEVLGSLFYELAPGFVVNSLTIWLVSHLSMPSESTLATFERCQKVIKAHC